MANVSAVKSPDENKPKRAAQGPRPAYLLVRLPEGVSKDSIEVVAVTRKADEALDRTSGDTDLDFLRVMIK